MKNTNPRQIEVFRGVLEVKLRLLFLGHPGQHAVKDVIVPLVFGLAHKPALLKQILLDPGSLDRAGRREMDVNVLAETRTVVVSDCFRISKGWKEFE